MSWDQFVIFARIKLKLKIHLYRQRLYVMIPAKGKKKEYHKRVSPIVRCLPVCLVTEKKGGQHMSWDQFVIFAIVALLCWGIGAVAAWRGKRQWMVYTATLAGLAVFFAFILGMWISLERPPMRTMGETRLWYSFFLPLAGIIRIALAI